jgi:hypothetical protein
MKEKQNISLGILMKSKTTAKFVNNNGEPCVLSKYYINNKQKIQVIFSNSLNDIAYKPAINSTSEKKIVKFLLDNNFTIVD